MKRYLIKAGEGEHSSDWQKRKDYTIDYIKTESFFFFSFQFLAALGLRCCAWAFSSCGKRELLFVVVHGLLIAVASLVAKHGL